MKRISGVFKKPTASLVSYFIQMTKTAFTSKGSLISEKKKVPSGTSLATRVVSRAITCPREPSCVFRGETRN